MHVLFLYASTGSGHLKAARYVNEALQQKNEETQITMVDVLNFCNYPLESFILNTFKAFVSKYPNLYRSLYRFTEKNILFNRLAGIFFRRSIKKLETLCASMKICTIVCTHPLALLFTSKLKQQLRDDAPTVMGIVTDYQLHRFWLHPKIDLYCVPNQEMKEELVSLGWPTENVKVTGIPCPINLFEQPQVSGHPFLLVSGGGWGLGNLESTTKSLLNTQLPLSLFVVTGENHSLYQRLKLLEQKYPGRLMVEGTIPQLFSVMKNAACVVTKPGGLTVTEAMLLKKPLILIEPLPGAEEKNLDYLVARGAAVPYSDFIEQPDLIGRWHETHSGQQASTVINDSSLSIADWILNNNLNKQQRYWFKSTM